MADFSEDEILQIADELRGFEGSSARLALERIADRLLLTNMERNLSEDDEKEKPRPYYRGYSVGVRSLLRAAETLTEQAEKIKGRPIER